MTTVLIKTRLVFGNFTIKTIALDSHRPFMPEYLAAISVTPDNKNVFFPRGISIASAFIARF